MAPLASSSINNGEVLEEYMIVAKAIFLSRPARPASWTNDSKDPG